MMTFARLFRRIDPDLAHLDDVVRYARARLGSQEDAEDLAMEVYLALQTRSALAVGKRDLKLYILGIARRKIADRLRRFYRPQIAPDQGTMPVALDTWGVLWSLSLEHQEVLCLRFMLGLSSQETAEIMERSPAAIDSLVQRAKAAYRAACADDINEDEPWSDHIEESLKNAAQSEAASQRLRERLEHCARIRHNRARAISGAGIAALAVLTITATPRASSAREVYDQVSKAFRNGKAFRITMYKHYEGDPEHIAMKQVVHPGGFISTFFVGSVMEFTMREDDKETVMYYPRLGLAQRPIKSLVSWREAAPKAEEELLAYIQRRLIAEMSGDSNISPLTPLRARTGEKIEGRSTVRLDFEDRSPDDLRLYSLYADQETKEPLLLAVSIDRQINGHRRLLKVRYTFAQESNPARLVHDLPPRGVTIADMNDAVNQLNRSADINPLFGGIKLAIRGPHGSLVLVTKSSFAAYTDGWKGNEIRLGGTTWMPAMSMSNQVGDPASPDYHVTTLIPVASEGGLDSSTLAPKEAPLPFPVTTDYMRWPMEAGMVMTGRGLSKEFTEIASIRSRYFQTLGDDVKAKQVLMEAAKHEDQLVPGFTVIIRERLIEIEKGIQR